MQEMGQKYDDFIIFILYIQKGDKNGEVGLVMEQIFIK